MIDVWQRELGRTRKLRNPPRVFVPRSLSKTERQLLRERAFALLEQQVDFEQVVDTLLIENDFLSWTQADNLVRGMVKCHAKD